MTNHQLNTDRDTVLYAFQDACDRPTPAQILDWTKRFPQFADDIIETANLLLELQPDREEPLYEASDSLLRRVQSDALSAVFEAEQAASGDDDSVAALRSTADGRRGPDEPDDALPRGADWEPEDFSD